MTAQKYSLAIALLAAATVLGALGFEHLDGQVPCALCLKERIPYYIGVPVALLAFYVLGKAQHIALGRVLMVLLGLIFATSMVLGSYHAGAEWGFWPGPQSCGGGTLGSSSAADLLQSLENVKIIRCDEASWRMFGLSFAGWNAVISLALTGLAYLGFKQALKA
jgi:disulfide bond formation protein DsbB